MSYNYADLIKVTGNPSDLGNFIQQAIMNFKGSALFKTAQIADDYDRGENTTITNYQRMIMTVTGDKRIDPFRATHRGASNFYHIFTSQLVQYLLANGILWNNDDTEKRLGANFSNQLTRLTKSALDGSVAYGFYNYDHLEVFPIYSRIAPCFMPIHDGETGNLRAGVRFWQYEPKAPLRASLYTEQGITEYIYITTRDDITDDKWQRLSETMLYKPTRAYQNINIKIPAQNISIDSGVNYSTLPIIPMYANYQHVSEITALREKIDAYDFILNGFADDLDNAQIYWIIRGAGGMDDPSLAQFLDRLRMVGAAAPEDGQDVQAITVNIPVEARERLLDRLKAQLYEDAQAFNPDDIKSGSTVTAQIDAAYEPMNLKANELEYCVLDFLYQLLGMLGIKDEEPTFTRDKLSNVDDQITTLIAASQYLSNEYVTERVLKLLGDGDKLDTVLQQMDAEDMERQGLDNANNPGEAE